MESALEKLRWERRRKLQIREAFRAGMTHFRTHGGDPVAFYRASAAYLVPAQRRLIDQDLRLADLLEPRVPPDATADLEGIRSLRERLHRSDEELQLFAAAAAGLENGGSDTVAAFEQAADRYLDYIINVLGARSHSLRHLTTTLFSEADWDHIAGITPAVIAEEGEQFRNVQRLAPAGIDPEKISTERPATR
jgi:hypothetical protein